MSGQYDFYRYNCNLTRPSRRYWIYAPRTCEWWILDSWQIGRLISQCATLICLNKGWIYIMLFISNWLKVFIFFAFIIWILSLRFYEQDPVWLLIDPLALAELPFHTSRAKHSFRVWSSDFPLSGALHEGTGFHKPSTTFIKFSSRTHIIASSEWIEDMLEMYIMLRHQVNALFEVFARDLKCCSNLGFNGIFCHTIYLIHPKIALTAISYLHHPWYRFTDFFPAKS